MVRLRPEERSGLSMKRILASILILAISLLALPVLAEQNYTGEILFSSECITALMQLKLQERMNTLSGGIQKDFASRLLGMNFAAPEKAYIFYPTDDQANIVAKMFDTLPGLLAQEIAADVNGRINAAYSAVADAAKIGEDLKAGYDLPDGPVFVLLVYPEDLSLTCVNGSSISSMFIACEAVPDGIDDAIIEETLASYNVKGTKYVEYSSDVLIKKINKTQDSWCLDMKNGSMMNTLALGMGQSIGAFRLLFPKIADSSWNEDFPAYFPGQLAGVLMDYAAEPGGSESRLTIAHFIADEINPGMASRFGLLWQYNNNATSRAGEWPLDKQPLLTGEQTSEPFDSKKTVIFVHERYNSDDNKEIKYNFYVLSALNAANVPQNVESSDYIAYAKTTWEEYREMNGVTLMSAITTMKLYDAKTGKWLMDLGTQRDDPSGYIVATSNIWYRQPSIEALAAKLIDLFR